MYFEPILFRPAADILNDGVARKLISQIAKMRADQWEPVRGQSMGKDGRHLDAVRKVVTNEWILAFRMGKNDGIGI